MDEVRHLSRLATGDVSGLEVLASLPGTYESSTARSLALSLMEKAFLSVFEETDFGREISADEHIRRAINSMLRLRPANNSGVWFGGRSKCNGSGGDREKWTSGILVGCTLLRDDALLVSSMEGVEKCYRNAAEFVFYMSGQDDRLLSVLLALLLQKRAIGEHSILKPSVACLHAFAAFGFQYEVLLDWLNSDLVSLPFLTRFLEDISQDLTAWQQDSEQVQKTRESVSEMSFMPGTWVQEEPENADVVLRLQEMAGSRLVEKEMRLSRKEPKRTWVPPRAETFEEPLFSKLYDMLVRLRLRLEAIESKGLGKFPSVVRLVERFEELVDGEDEAMEEEEGEEPMESDEEELEEGNKEMICN